MWVSDEKVIPSANTSKLSVNWIGDTLAEIKDSTDITVTTLQLAPFEPPLLPLAQSRESYRFQAVARAMSFILPLPHRRYRLR